MFTREEYSDLFATLPQFFSAFLVLLHCPLVLLLLNFKTPPFLSPYVPLPAYNTLLLINSTY